MLKLQVESGCREGGGRGGGVDELTTLTWWQGWDKFFPTAIAIHTNSQRKTIH
jgi:hypothetical protein